VRAFQALYDMHSKKMVHMDVKLQNVLVGSGEVYKVRARRWQRLLRRWAHLLLALT
jgi:hypothetical protein